MNTRNRLTIHPLNHLLVALCLALLCAGVANTRAGVVDPP